MDAAKGVALLAANGGRILDYEGIDRIEHPIPPMIMLPSTSGTGADVSQFCIVTDTERHTKITIMGRALVPDVSVIDPRLLTTMPDDLNAATGLDALTHGIEAFVSLAHGPLTDHHALQAISLVHANLVRTMMRPDDAAARSAMAQAALEAGLAFTNAILGRDARDEPPGGRACSTCRTAWSTACCCRTSSGSTAPRCPSGSSRSRRPWAWRTWRARPRRRPSSGWPRRCAGSATRSACRRGSATSA